MAKLRNFARRQIFSLGSGADTVVFVADNSEDTIKNFGDTDKLDVTALTGASAGRDFISAVASGATLASGKIIYAESTSTQEEANVTTLFVDAASTDELTANKIKLAVNVSSSLLAVKFSDATGLYSVATDADGDLGEDGVQLVGTINAGTGAATLTAASFGLTTE